MTLSQLRVDGRVADDLASAQWRPARLDESVPDGASSAELSDTDGGLQADFSLGPSGSPGVVRRDVPDVLDALLGPLTEPAEQAGDLVRGTTLGAAPTTLRVADRLPALPRLGQDGALVDLRSVALVAPSRRPGTTSQVWLSQHAPADAEQALAAAGLDVTGAETSDRRRAQLDDSGPALALLVLLIAGGTVLPAGLTGVATSVAARSRRRGFETASLRALAVSDRDISRSGRLEHAVLVVPGLVLGAVGGGVSVLLTVEVLPSATGATRPVAALPGAGTVWLPVLGVTVLAALLVGAVTALAGRAPGRAATADRLREAQA